jgi:hypothetical protein
MKVCKPCHYALVEAVEPLKLHPMSMSYIYERFAELQMSPTCRQHVVMTQDFAPILARWAGVADTKLKMSGPFVLA